MKMRIVLLAATALYATPGLAQPMAAGKATEHVLVYGALPDSGFHPQPIFFPATIPTSTPNCPPPC